MFILNHLPDRHGVGHELFAGQYDPGGQISPKISLSGFGLVELPEQ